jgi:uncharacterized phage-associated protein
MQGFNYKKATQALNYLVEKSDGTLNKMKAIKLIWLSDRLHIRKYGRMITSDFYFALPYGPVPSTTRNILELNSTFITDVEYEYSKVYIENIDQYTIKSKKESNLRVFSKTDIEVIDTVFITYGHLDHFSLSDLSHSFPEWTKYDLQLKSKIASRFAIEVEDFFVNVNDGTNLFMDSEEQIDIAKEIFNDSLNLFVV